MVCTSCAWKTPCYHCACASASPKSERMPWYSHAVCCITNPSFQMPSSHEQRTRFTRHKILLLFVWSFFLCLQRGACCWAGAMHTRSTISFHCDDVVLVREGSMQGLCPSRSHPYSSVLFMSIYTLARTYTVGLWPPQTDMYPKPKQYNRCILSEIKTPAIEWPTIGQQPVWRYEYEVYTHLGGIVRSSVEKWDATKMTDPDS